MICFLQKYGERKMWVFIFLPSLFAPEAVMVTAPKRLPESATTDTYNFSHLSPVK